MNTAAKIAVKHLKSWYSTLLKVKMLNALIVKARIQKSLYPQFLLRGYQETLEAHADTADLAEHKKSGRLPERISPEKSGLFLYHFKPEL